MEQRDSVLTGNDPANKVVEFDHFKPRIIHYFPYTQKFQDCPGIQPVFDS